MEIQQQKVMDISHFLDYQLTLNIQGIKCTALPHKHLERGERKWFQVLTTHPTLDKYLDVDVSNQTTINKYGLRACKSDGPFNIKVLCGGQIAQ